MRVRTLNVADTSATRRFLEAHPDTTMFLRANLRENGLPVPGERPGTAWVGVEVDHGIAAVVAHDAKGRVVLEAPVGLDVAVRGVVEATGRPVRGILGPRDQVDAARTVLGLDGAPAQLDTRERLMALPLTDLVVPGPLCEGIVRCRRALRDDLEVLYTWRSAYEAEVVHVAETASVVAARRERLAKGIADGIVWVLERGEEPVAMSAFNATLPDCVQIGGVYTPPPQRSRGYARAVVAGSLLVARRDGVLRSVLFTDSSAGERAYAAIGFRVIGDYGLLIFE